MLCPVCQGKGQKPSDGYFRLALLRLWSIIEHPLVGRRNMANKGSSVQGKEPINENVRKGGVGHNPPPQTPPPKPVSGVSKPKK